MYYSTVLVTHTTHKHISPYARSRRIYDTGHSRGYQGKVFNSPSALVSSLLCSPLLSSPLVYRLHVCVTVNCMCASQIACIRQGLHVCASQRGTHSRHSRSSRSRHGWRTFSTGCRVAQMLLIYLRRLAAGSHILFRWPERDCMSGFRH